ncbi:hypothetical protein Ancab_033396 [Ancistrocladus abbreviatus]
MGFALFPSSTMIISKSFSNFPPLNHGARNFREEGKLNFKTIHHENLLNKDKFSTVLHSTFSSNLPRRRSVIPRKRGGITSVPFCVKKSESGKEDYRALETVLRLYSAIKSRDLKDLSDIIGEECRCISNFVLAFEPLHGKEQVLEFFSFLIGQLGNNVEFIVQPILYDGLNIGVRWKLECQQTHAPLGKGFSFHVLHVYQGKLVLRNVGIFMEPLVHLEPLRLMMMRIIVETVSYTNLLKGLLKSKKATFLFLSILLMAASMFFLKQSFH